MKGAEKKRVSAIRLILAAIKQKEIDSRTEVDDSEVLVILSRLAKQRKESITQFLAASRKDLADIEENELVLINSYLPEQMSEAKILELVENAIRETNAKTLKDMGKVMAKLSGELKGKADMAVVSKTVKSRL